MIKILGIDPGSINTGYGIIESRGNHNKHIKNGVIRIKAKTLWLQLGIFNNEAKKIVHALKKFFN